MAPGEDEHTVVITIVRVELSSDSASSVDAACNDIISSMKRIGASYGGPIPMPKRRENGRTVHTRVVEIDSDPRAVSWLKSYVCPAGTEMRCTVVEKRS